MGNKSQLQEVITVRYKIEVTVSFFSWVTFRLITAKLRITFARFEARSHQRG